MIKKIFTILCQLFLFCSFSYAQLNDSFTDEQKWAAGAKANAEPPVEWEKFKNSGLELKPDGILRWSEGFEGVNFPPAGWTVYDPSLTSTQKWEKFSASAIYGKLSASVRYESDLPVSANDDWLITPSFTVTAGDVFYFWAKGAVSIYSDSLEIYYSFTGGIPPAGYNKITSVKVSSLDLFSIPLNFLAAKSIYLAFRYKETNQFRAYLDSVYVASTQSNDAGITKINVNSDLPAGDLIPKVTVKNFGYLPQTFTVKLTINPGGYTSSKTVANLAAYSSTQVLFDKTTLVKGNYKLAAKTITSSNGIEPNDTLSKSITVNNVIFDNGSFVNYPDAAPDGADGSILEQPLNSYGFNNSIASGIRVADDFTVPADTMWNIENITFYEYQSGASTGQSTFTSLNYRIWKGYPNAAGSVVVFGDTTTNRLVSSSWAESYRFASSSSNTLRPIFANTVSAGFTLTKGTYWIDWQTDGSITSGAWVIPVCKTGIPVTGDALQYSGSWFSIKDSTKGVIGSYSQGIPFKIKGTIISTVIPVELKTFTANIVEGNVLLNWSTADEINNYGYKIERKEANSAYKEIGFVKGSGNSTEIKYYSFTDTVKKEGTYFYRLKQIDYNGAVNFSDEVSLKIIKPQKFLLEQNYPNPFNPVTKINFSLMSNSKVTLQIFNALGQKVITLINQNLEQGEHNYSFDAGNLNSGVYIYQLTAKGADGAFYSSVKKMMLVK